MLDKGLKQMPRSLKITLSVIVMISFALITISAAMAVSIDDEDRFVLARGESVDSSFLIIDASDVGRVTTTSSLISFDGKRSLSYDELDKFEDALVVEYTVEVAETLPIGRYVETIRVNDDNEILDMVVEINVQRDGFITLSRIESFGNTKINTGLVIFIIFVVLVSIFVILENRSVRK